MRIFLSILIIFSLCSIGWAETIYLKDGRTYEGKIIERGDYYVSIESQGVPYKFYTDEIDRIEEAKDPNQLPALQIDLTKLPNISKKKIDLILKLVEVNGTRRSMQNNLDQIVAKANENKKEELRKLLNIDEIMTSLIPLYDKHFSEVELVQLIQFYSSPLGHKILETMPVLLNEAVEVSVKYFEQKIKETP